MTVTSPTRLTWCVSCQAWAPRWHTWPWKVRGAPSQGLVWTLMCIASPIGWAGFEPSSQKRQGKRLKNGYPGQFHWLYALCVCVCVCVLRNSMLVLFVYRRGRGVCACVCMCLHVLRMECITVCVCVCVCIVHMHMCVCMCVCYTWQTGNY